MNNLDFYIFGTPFPASIHLNFAVLILMTLNRKNLICWFHSKSFLIDQLVRLFFQAGYFQHFQLKVLHGFRPRHQKLQMVFQILFQFVPFTVKKYDRNDKERCVLPIVFWYDRDNHREDASHFS